jgi:hypothetical protein
MKKQPIQNLQFGLPVSVFQQDDVFVAFTPALDISTYGESKVEAKKNFEELVNTFFSEFEDARELEEVLSSLGWTKQNANWQPPKEVEHKVEKFNVPALLMTA